MIHKTIQGKDVPAIGLGTYMLTGRACRYGVADALEIGYRHIDTAVAYGNESEVGAGLRDAGVDRKDIFLTTKVWMDRLSPNQIRASAEESLGRLDTEYVDLLLIHWPTLSMDLEACLDALHGLQESGATRHIGVSNFPPALTRRAVAHAPVFCNQIEFHPYLAQDALMALARQHDFLLTAYSPLARGHVLKDETLKEIASTHGKTPAQATLRWLIQLDGVAAIPKASDRHHRRRNFEVFDFELTAGDMQRIANLARGRRFVDPSWAPAW